MRTLYLMRHGEARRGSPQLGTDPPLTPRGRADAAVIATHMQQRQWLPALVLCSPARRARETWQAMAPVLGPDILAQEDASLFLASAERLLDRVLLLSDTCVSAMLIAHNPGLQNLVAMILRTDDQAAWTRVNRGYPAAGLAVLSVPGDTWTDFWAGNGRLEHFVTADDLTRRLSESDH
jgi:phosphohistidine phosphatase